jgi:hypothetical protein
LGLGPSMMNESGRGEVHARIDMTDYLKCGVRLISHSRVIGLSAVYVAERFNRARDYHTPCAEFFKSA